MEFVIIGLLSLAVGAVVGFFGGKYIMMKYIKENSTINEQMVISMMTSMGQKPNQKKVKQIMKTLNNKKL